jgi:hypothetical protein
MEPGHAHARLNEGVSTDTTAKGADMDTLVLSTLILQSLGIVVTVLALAVSSCLPGRRLARRWAPLDNAVRPASVQHAMIEMAEDAELPRAA